MATGFYTNTIFLNTTQAITPKCGPPPRNRSASTVSGLLNKLEVRPGRRKTKRNRDTTL